MTDNITADSMTSLERLIAWLEGKPYDHILINPMVGEHAANVIGIKASEYNLSAKKMAEAHIAAYRTSCVRKYKENIK